MIVLKSEGGVVMDEGARGMVWMAFALYGHEELFMEGGYRKRRMRRWRNGMRRDLDVPIGGDVGICLSIPSGNVLDSGKNRFAKRPTTSSAGTFGIFVD